MKVRPLRNETRPEQPIRWEQPRSSFPHKVKDRETWITVARVFDVKSPEYLIFFNFYVFIDVKQPDSPQHRRATNEVNWYLREYVGCDTSTDGGRNWAFSGSARPGIIYIPVKTYDFEGDGVVVAGSTGIGTDSIAVPHYDDSNLMDVVSKALDIYGMADMAIGVSEVALPALVEAGLIVTSTAASIVGPSVAVGAPHADALKHHSRNYFFQGFAIGLIMAANGASRDYARRRELKYPPLVPTYPEKAETFRKLHNSGLELGFRQGKRFNTVDQKKLFAYLHSQLSGEDSRHFNPRIPWKDWSDEKRTSYYDKMSGIIKHRMLKDNLQLRIK